MSDELLAAIHTELMSQGKTLSGLETDMKSLVGGNGKPSRVEKIESDVDSLKTAKNYAMGFGAGFLSLEIAYHAIMHKLGLK